MNLTAFINLTVDINDIKSIVKSELFSTVN